MFLLQVKLQGIIHLQKSSQPNDSRGKMIPPIRETFLLWIFTQTLNLHFYLALGLGPIGPQEKFFLRHIFLAQMFLKYFKAFYYAGPEIIEVKVCNRQTERKTNSLTLYMKGVDFFQLNALPTYLLRSQGNNDSNGLSVQLLHFI